MSSTKGKAAAPKSGAGNRLHNVTVAPSPGAARLRIDASVRSEIPISRRLTGKFCEHLGSNIYNGMCAQILVNSTFAAWPFGAHGEDPPDGGRAFESDPRRIETGVRNMAVGFGLPEAAAGDLCRDYRDGLAFGWLREKGTRGGAVVVSPDAGKHGGRAQRVEVEPGGGIAQYLYLPLHRVRKYRFELLIRSPDLEGLDVVLYGAGGRELCRAAAAGLGTEWEAVEGELTVPAGGAEAGSPGARPPAGGPLDHALHRLALTSAKAGRFVVDRFLLWPDDHIEVADPDVVRFLKESRLPVQRWPGGNFASGYHWEDGIGPSEARPTRPNPAWGGVEPNIFGTDELMAFCRNVGCEPMICVNAGNGGPEEAARWVEYCNGSAETPGGRRRAENGHPEPYDVKLWEIGNEIYGRWQCGWTTPAGNADRFRRFSEAMLAVDPDLELYACGDKVFVGDDWNGKLFAECADILQRTTDHALVGSSVSSQLDPVDVYNDFMAYPLAFEERYGEIRDIMEREGIREPRLAITELMLFAHLRTHGAGGGTLNRSNLVSPDTLAEALYLTLYYHTAVRLAPFIELITHSATVNHGGGLRKERERVYANPVYHARSLFHRLTGGLPVKTELEAGAYTAPLVLSDLMAAGFGRPVPMVDAVAAVDEAGALIVSLVNRSPDAPVDLEIEVQGFEPQGLAAVTTISGERPWSANSLRQPESIAPEASSLDVQGRQMGVTLPKHSVVQIAFAPSA